MRNFSNNNLSALLLENYLPKLQFLYIKDNHYLSRFKPTCVLEKLRILDLRNCDIRNIPSDYLLFFPRLETIYLYGNPLESAFRGFIEDSKYKNNLPDLEGYLKEIKKGEEKDNECKVLLLGNGNVGKTTFATRLTQNKFVDKRISTHGVDITLQPYRLDDYILNIWDFGGQDIYHATHRLFMQTASIYLIFWDKITEYETPKDIRPEGDEEIEHENHDLSYWLHYASLLGKKSPVIIVQTQRDRDGNQQIPQLIYSNFEEKLSYLESVSIESKGKGDDWGDSDWKLNRYDNLKHLIKDAIPLAKPSTEIPKSYYKLRDEIRKLQQQEEEETPHLNQTEYINLAISCDVDDPMNVLENWLSKTGIVFYRKGLFQNKIILDQARVIKVIYTLF